MIQNDSASSPTADKLPQPPSESNTLGWVIRDLFKRYDGDRRLWEINFLQNLRQIRGEYDPDVKIAKNRSRVYPKLTRVKVVSVVARLMQLLFPVVEKCWTLAPSPIPNMDKKVLQQILAAIPNAAQMSDEQINQAINDEAEKRTAAMSLEIEDQLKELGGTDNLSFVMLCKKVITHGVKYGMGILKGPLVREEKQTAWKRGANGQLEVTTKTVYRPCFEVVPPWQYYNDMSAQSLCSQDFEFERMVMSRREVYDLAELPGFDEKKILQFLRAHPNGNYSQRNFESDIRALGAEVSTRSPHNKYEVLCGWGQAQVKLLRDSGVEGIPADADDLDYVEAHVWLLDNVVIKAELNPYKDKGRPYHIFLFEEDDINARGESLPEIMRDAQMGMSAAARMIVDNAAVTAGPMYEINRSLIDLADDDGDIHAFKVWHRDDEGPLAQYPAVKEIPTRSHIPELMNVYNTFRELADTETLMNPATQGDFSKVASEPFRTSSGVSQLMQGAALPFRDVVRNFDQFIVSVMSSLVSWNMQFNDKQEIMGDHRVIARGADSLIAKEVRAGTVDGFVATLRPEEAQYVDFRGLLEERVKVRDLPTDKVLLSDQEVQANQSRQQAMAEEQRQQQNMIVEAQLREIIANAVNKLSQARKHSVDAVSGMHELDAASQQALELGHHQPVKPIDLQLEQQNRMRQAGGG